MKRAVPRLDGPAKVLAKGELVGLHARIAKSPDAGLVDLAGDIVDETLKTISLRVAGGRIIQVAKAACTFAISPRGGGNPVLVDGRAIEFRPEDRTKKVR